MIMCRCVVYGCRCCALVYNFHLFVCSFRGAVNISKGLGIGQWILWFDMLVRFHVTRHTALKMDSHKYCVVIHVVLRHPLMSTVYTEWRRREKNNMFSRRLLRFSPYILLKTRQWIKNIMTGYFFPLIQLNAAEYWQQRNDIEISHRILFLFFEHMSEIPRTSLCRSVLTSIDRIRPPTSHTHTHIAKAISGAQFFELNAAHSARVKQTNRNK